MKRARSGVPIPTSPRTTHTQGLFGNPKAGAANGYNGNKRQKNQPQPAGWRENSQAVDMDAAAPYDGGPPVGTPRVGDARVPDIIGMDTACEMHGMSEAQ